MKNQLKVSLLALALAMTAVSAQAAVPTGGMRIAVVDRDVIMGTDAAKAASEKLAVELKPQRDKLEQLSRDIKTQEGRLQKEAATMSERDKKALRDQLEAKANDYNALIQQVQKRTLDVQQDLYNRMLPKVKVILEGIRKNENYDVILDTRSVVAINPDLDLTKRVVDGLNAAK